MGLPSYRVILFDRAAVNHPAGFLFDSPWRLEDVAFQKENSLSNRNANISGLNPAAHSLA
jgi:hypothetical protein